VLAKPSLMTRIVVGKTAGFAIGLVGLLLLPSLAPGIGWGLRLGFLFWYTTLGAIVAVFGVFTWHPVLRVPLPWWLIGPALGAWMNFVVTLLAFPTLRSLLVTMFGANGPLGSPYWFIAEGAVVGLVIGFLTTRYGGEGPETAGH
jgi:hypothetical protein